MSETSDTAGVPNRRTVVAGVGVAGLAAALTACGGSEDSSKSGSTGTAPDKGGSPAPGSGSGGLKGYSVAANKIPSGGGTIFEGQKLVVTQPTSGQYKAFSAVCPHAGCVVNEVTDGEIVCPCHQSKFSITDGSRKSGPATKGLTPIKATAENNEIKLG
jgi:nitrite reductase/ring-hydroxylating ferredoxin subunit